MTPADRNEPGSGPESGPDSGPDSGPAATPPRAPRRWRLGTPLVLAVCGSLFVVSGTNSQGTDLRPGRYTDLASLTESESRAYQKLQGEAGDLEAEVDRLTRAVDDEDVRREERRAARLRSVAGLEAVTGEGVSIVMSDAPEEVLVNALEEAGDEAASVNTFPYVVHQQDIQAVVNALWAGGATAVTIQGQRIVTTTGIKCSGSAVQLQGVPYPAPYTIEAVGDPQDLLDSVGSDGYVAGFRADADRPEVGVGWQIDAVDQVEAPAYDGLLDIDLARPSR